MSRQSARTRPGAGHQEREGGQEGERGRRRGGGCVPGLPTGLPTRNSRPPLHSTHFCHMLGDYVLLYRGDVPNGILGANVPFVALVLILINKLFGTVYIANGLNQTAPNVLAT